MTRRSVVAAIVLATGGLGAGALFGQSFEVAVIKPADPTFTGRITTMQGAHQFVARNHTLKTLIEAAYNLTPRAISGGPAWIDSEHYDILAGTPGELHPGFDEQMSMLRQLLTDRFGLAFHREPKELAVYELTVAKDGPRLKESAGPPSDGLHFVLYPGRASLPAKGGSMAELASVLQRAALDRPVVDKTGLTGRYDFDLNWSPDESQFGGAIARLGGADASDQPDLYTAMQRQLGLKLEAVKGRIEALVIDHAERPAEN